MSARACRFSGLCIITPSDSLNRRGSTGLPVMKITVMPAFKLRARGGAAEVDIGQQHLEAVGLLAQHLIGGQVVTHRPHVEALVLQQFVQNDPHMGIVFNNQHSRTHNDRPRRPRGTVWQPGWFNNSARCP
jgi:hypothetical protein